MLSSISFWGSVASIVALAYGIVSFLMNRVSKFSSQLDETKRKIVQTLKEVEVEANSATTQARRMDLYIYKESVLAEARHRMIKRKLEILVYVVFLGVLFLFITTADINSQVTTMGFAAKELSSIAEAVNVGLPDTSLSKEKLGLLLAILYVVLVVILWLEMRELKIIQNRVSDISLAFISAFEELLKKNYKSNLQLSEKISE